MDRICPKRGCPKIAVGRYCPTHNSEHEKQRGSREERGYGAEFQRLRRAWAKEVAKGTVPCGRCGKLIHPNTPFHLDHDDNDRNNLTLATPSHPHCNTRAGGQAAHQ